MSEEWENTPIEQYYSNYPKQKEPKPIQHPNIMIDFRINIVNPHRPPNVQIANGPGIIFIYFTYNQSDYTVYTITYK